MIYFTCNLLIINKVIRSLCYLGVGEQKNDKKLFAFVFVPLGQFHCGHSHW